MPTELFCTSYTALADATGVSVYELKSIHKFSRAQADCPFIGRSGGYASDLRKWKLAHRDFIPSHQWSRSPAKNSGPSRTPAGRGRSASGKSDAPKPTSGSHTASPAAPEPLCAPSR